MSVAIGRSQRTIVLPAFLRFMSVVCQSVSLSITDVNCKFSAVRSPIGLKLSGDLGLVSKISGHVWVSRFVYFLYCKQTKEQKTLKLRKSRFYKTCVFSAMPSSIDLKLGGDIRTSTRNSVVCLFCCETFYVSMYTYRICPSVSKLVS